MTTAALIAAGGRGTRAAADLPKQYARLGSSVVLAWTLKAFLGHPAVDIVQVVIGAGDERLYEAAVKGLPQDKLLPPVKGGATRQASVRNGLAALAARSPERVLIHDAARPFVGTDVIDRVLAALVESPGAIAAMPLTDTIKRAATGNRVAATLDRSQLWSAQTPQGFRFPDILEAHERARAAGRDDLTDDAAVAEWAGLAVTLVPGSAANRKLTTAEDLAMANRVIAGPEVRTGQGFDVHRLVPGDHVWLGGVRIAHTHGLQGHSDADVALHALTDALLGAIGAGDIGQHFPDTDPRWKGAASHIFLAEAGRLVAARGGSVGNVDVTLLCEAPKIAPHREAMRRRIAEILGIDAARVSVKATTTEGLGFTGRREGIAAMATATVLL
ncbi:MAG TPA: bifunctional 2-C-methyl-D-erythritol 4-phosphate cytidylyltransferase/2-C-methyl-D-erythritol 2,4-cyclodiphosphate synthase, partial [Hyphomicrobiaceae bacterium]|nr:bifunctional 2-C-methyl-D-erythritol 4-phosphate cytidylyltransferase/2-C-methyl-D-erythritol 2,4-cyclodiphosphate synthase [Hyphomicrobiaceae bacterium]